QRALAARAGRLVESADGPRLSTVINHPPRGGLRAGPKTRSAKSADLITTRGRQGPIVFWNDADSERSRGAAAAAALPKRSSGRKRTRSRLRLSPTMEGFDVEAR